MNPPRTTADAVRGVLGDEYGPRRDRTLPDLRPYIRVASSLVDAVISLAAQRGLFSLAALSSLSSDQAADLETWLAAHFYQQADPGYQSRSTGGASGSFNGQTQMGLKNTRFGQQAMVIDTTGVLRAMDERRVAGLEWLGKPVSQQIPYEERD